MYISKIRTQQTEYHDLYRVYWKNILIGSSSYDRIKKWIWDIFLFMKKFKYTVMIPMNIINEY